MPKKPTNVGNLSERKLNSVGERLDIYTNIIKQKCEKIYPDRL